MCRYTVYSNFLYNPTASLLSVRTNRSTKKASSLFQNPLREENTHAPKLPRWISWTWANTPHDDTPEQSSKRTRVRASLSSPEWCLLPLFQCRCQPLVRWALLPQKTCRATSPYTSGRNPSRTAHQNPPTIKPCSSICQVCSWTTWTSRLCQRVSLRCWREGVWKKTRQRRDVWASNSAVVGRLDGS